MFQCYVDIGSGTKGGSTPRLSCCAAYLAQGEDGSGIFARRWRHLLLKHELRTLDLSDWRNAAAAHGWDEQRQAHVLREFSDATSAHDLLGFVVTIDSGVWQMLEHKSRQWFGTEQDFCLQKLARTVLDRVEANTSAGAVSLTFDRDIDRLREMSNSIQKLFKTDSRAQRQIPAIKLVDPETDCHLQASRLLRHIAIKHFSHPTARDIAIPASKKMIKALPDLPESIQCEIWDKSYAQRHLASLHWLASDVRPAKASRRR